MEIRTERIFFVGALTVEYVPFPSKYSLWKTSFRKKNTLDNFD